MPPTTALGRGWALFSTPASRALAFGQDQGKYRVRALRRGVKSECFPFERGRTKGRPYVVRSPRDSFTSRAYKAGLRNVFIFFSLHGDMWLIALGTREKISFSHLCSPLSSYQSDGLVSCLPERWEEGRLTNSSCSDLRQRCRGQEKVTFVQNSFGPDFLFVKVTCIGLTSAEAVAQRTNPFVRWP